MVRLDELTAHAPGLSLKISASFQKDLASLRQATVTTFQLGTTNLKGKISSGKDVDYKIFVEGSFLDLRPYLEAFKTKKSTNFQLSKSFDLRAYISTMTLLKDRHFFNNSLSLRFLKGRTHSATYKGFLNPETTKEFYVDILPRPHDGRRLRLKCQDAGYMLKALNFFDDIAEGNLKLTANQFDDEPESPWQGKLEIQAFFLEKAPTISRLLSMAFPTRIVSSFSAKGLPFDRLKIKFKKSGSHISLYRGRSYSPKFWIFG